MFNDANLICTIWDSWFDEEEYKLYVLYYEYNKTTYDFEMKLLEKDLK